MRLAALALLLLLSAVPTHAETSLTPGGDASVGSVIDGTTLDLADGRQLRLAGIEAPSQGTGARAAKAALGELVSSGVVTLRFAGNPQDRQGRAVAQVYSGTIWIEGELVKRGLARVRSAADNRAGIAELLVLERQARRYHRGLWADRAYAIRDAEDAGRYTGTFQLVTGTVGDVGTAAGEVFIAFGPDRHSAFTLTLAPAVAKLCRDAGLDPIALKGKVVLARGFIDGTVHPSMTITHPEQIELPRQKKTAPKKTSGPR